jgi:LPXTG-site transpeptidase (sortase) family protein
MAQKLHPSQRRSVQTRWLLAIIIAATTLFWPLHAFHGNGVHQSGIITQAISVQKHKFGYVDRSIPLQISIPSIFVDSKIMQLGLDKDGSLAVPPDGSLAGWYKGSPTPGEIGPSVIAGHVDWKGKMGVFFRLRSVKVGAIVKVRRVDGSTQTFRVERIEAFAKKNFPSHQVYGNIAYAGLRLITCGDFNFQLHKYVKDIVVFAKARV